MASNFAHVDLFFKTARERYNIKLRRDKGQPFPWTDDPILRDWRFTNVHREDDRTTRWFRENIRDPLSITNDHLKIVQGTLIFRWFNRIETGEIIKDLLLFEWDTKEAKERLDGISPIVTGAYIIKAGDGVSKLDGILNCIDEALPRLPPMVSIWEKFRLGNALTLKMAWNDLTTLHFMGGFMSYEVVTDLRWTPVLRDAKDIMTWGNLGPGAIRGIGRVVAGNPELYANSRSGQAEMLKLMGELLELSKDQMYWPQQWPGWEMHEVEMWLCEFAKYFNALEGLRLKRRYQP